MATEKNFRTRIQLKTDTKENWSLATSFVPKKGEPIVVQSTSGVSELRIGDGAKTASNLPSIGSFYTYGDTLPATAEDGQLFFLLQN